MVGDNSVVTVSGSLFSSSSSVSLTGGVSASVLGSFTVPFPGGPYTGSIDLRASGAFLSLTFGADSCVTNPKSCSASGSTMSLQLFLAANIGNGHYVLCGNNMAGQPLGWSLFYESGQFVVSYIDGAYIYVGR